MIKKTFIHKFTALFLISAAFSINAHADNSPITGEISFTGYIVHPSCGNEISTNEISLHCQNDKADEVTNRINLNNISPTKNWIAMSDGRNEYSYNWINENKNLGMVTVRYH